MTESPNFPPKDRVRITTYGGEWKNEYQTVQHWQLTFDGLFLCDTSVPEYAEKWKELAWRANRV
jgi:hypothetical protein